MFRKPFILADNQKITIVTYPVVYHIIVITVASFLLYGVLSQLGHRLRRSIVPL